jgi:hypothetical protein
MLTTRKSTQFTQIFSGLSRTGVVVVYHSFNVGCSLQVSVFFTHLMMRTKYCAL